MLLKLGFSDGQIVDYLYFASLSRHPTDAERTALVGDLAVAEQQKIPGVEDARRAALIDMSWSLLTSEEFMFNH